MSIVQTDHDLLIRIDTKLDIYNQAMTELKTETDKRFDEVWTTLDGVKGDILQARGFLSGSKALWAVIGALPPSVVAALLLGLKGY